MSESKFTSGEWTACFAHDGKGTIFSWHVTGAKHGSTHPICGLRSVSPEMRSSDEDRANARLIAAAPELYDALQSIMLSADNLLRLVDELRERGEADHWQSIQCADLAADVNIARKALLKATPEQSDV